MFFGRFTCWPPRHTRKPEVPTVPLPLPPPPPPPPMPPPRARPPAPAIAEFELELSPMPGAAAACPGCHFTIEPFPSFPGLDAMLGVLYRSPQLCSRGGGRAPNAGADGRRRLLRRSRPWRVQGGPLTHAPTGLSTRPPACATWRRDSNGAIECRSAPWPQGLAAPAVGSCIYG